jgi:hypothetical protein
MLPFVRSSSAPLGFVERVDVPLVLRHLEQRRAARRAHAPDVGDAALGAEVHAVVVVVEAPPRRLRARGQAREVAGDEDADTAPGLVAEPCVCADARCVGRAAGHREPPGALRQHVGHGAARDYLGAPQLGVEPVGLRGVEQAERSGHAQRAEGVGAVVVEHAHRHRVRARHVLRGAVVAILDLDALVLDAAHVIGGDDVAVDAVVDSRIVGHGSSTATAASTRSGRPCGCTC